MHIITLFSQIFGCVIINSLVANNFLMHNDSESCIDIWEEDERVHVIRIINNGSHARTILVPNFNSEVNKNSSKVSSGKSVLHNYETVTDVQNTSNITDNFDKNNTQKENRNFPIYVRQTNNYNEKRSSSNESNDTISKYNISAEFTKLRIRDQHSKFNIRFRMKNLFKNVSEEINQPADARQPDQDTRKLAKFLNLFTIVHFSNDACVTSSGNGGTCYHLLECKSIGGEADGVCAQGYGVCCYSEQYCGGRTSINGTYFTGRNLLNRSESEVYVCTLYVEKSHPHVKQIRLDFQQFELTGPVEGNCTIDKFVITGQNNNDIIPIICGFNSGQHIYVDVDSIQEPIMLAVLSSGAVRLPNFKIRITQFKDGNSLLAPNNCLQYYNMPSGYIESFNYKFSPDNSTVPGYMNNLNYAICFQKGSDYCSIKYTNVEMDGTEYPFEINNIEQDGSPSVPPGQAGVEIFNCPDDYIVVSGTRLCGQKFNDATVEADYLKNYPVTDSTNGPIILTFKTNENVTGRGFHFIYNENPCPS